MISPRQHVLLCFHLLFTILFLSLSQAQAQEPLVIGIDHIPVVVRDLEKAQLDFRAMGFAIKPGRIHADGIQNAHVKFPDGTEIELITAPKAVDALTQEYRAKIASGEGPVYFGLYAPDQGAVSARLRALPIEAQNGDGMVGFSAASPLHPLFLGQRNKTPTDKPEHFAHPNGAARLSALWVRDTPELRELLKGMGVALTPANLPGFIGVANGLRAALPEGNLYLVPSGKATVIAARVDVRKIGDIKAVLKANAVPMTEYPACDKDAVCVPPSFAYGIWIEFAAPVP